MESTATCRDLVEQALAAASAQQPELLLRAETLADGAADWQRLADAWAAKGDTAAAERCLVAALAESVDGVWDHRRAAMTRVALGDHAGAVATLAALERIYVARGETSGLSWRLLAEGFGELQDDAGVRRCLDAGRLRGVTADDGCAVATGFLALLDDRDAALRLVAMAAERALTEIIDPDDPSAFGCSTVASVWRDLGEFDRAVALLTAALDRAPDTGCCLWLARAWSFQGEVEGAHAAAVQRCLQKASALAQLFEPWFDVAKATHECGGRVLAVREALAKAQALATSTSQFGRLAFAWRTWLGDAEAAQRCGPCGRTPAELAPPGLSPTGWARDAGALFDWLRARLDDDALLAIASCDYQSDVDEHLAALQLVRDAGRVPIPLSWHPREVLMLTRWGEGLQVDHVSRAFCCTVLGLGALDDDGRGVDSIEDTLAVLLESCMLLGRDALERLPPFLVALLDGPAERDRTELAHAMLALLLAGVQLDGDDARLEALAARLLTLEAELVHDDRQPHPEHGFVLGSTHYDQSVAVWQRIVRTTLRGLRVDAARPALAQVVQRLLTR